MMVNLKILSINRAHYSALAMRCPTTKKKAPPQSATMETIYSIVRRKCGRERNGRFVANAVQNDFTHHIICKHTEHDC